MDQNRKQYSIKTFEGDIQAAVSACAGNGGGVVTIPEGEWYSGKIHLKSHVHIQMEKGAVIRFYDSCEEYLPVVFTRWEGSECYNYSPLIYANGCEDVAITGPGTLVGSGQAWWHWKDLQQKAAEELCYAELNGIPVEKRIYGSSAAALRPSFVQTINCKNVLFEDFTIMDGPQWTLHPVYCEDVIVRNVTVITHGPNTDGLNPDSCMNVLIEGCTFDTGDDCIAVNAGINEDGQRVGRPCSNIEIRDCVMTGGHGAITIGSAVSGGVEHVYVHDCHISNTMQGIRIKSMRGRGGYVRDIKYENIEMRNVTEQAIQVTMFYEFSTVKPKTSKPSDFEDIVIRNVEGSSKKQSIQINGLPEHRLKNIRLENISIISSENFTCNDVENLDIENVTVRTVEGI